MFKLLLRVELKVTTAVDVSLKAKE